MIATPSSQTQSDTSVTSATPDSGAIAIVGMAGRFPGAESVDAFWENLKAGVESVSHFAPEEIEAQDEAAKKGGDEYIRARSILPNADKFDPAFFNIHPKEADYMDPQHRIFLECCWEALESGGYDPQQYSGLIGVYGGCSLNTYLLANLCTDRGFINELTGTYPVSYFQQALGNDKDFLATRVSYKLNLRGPSMTVQAACATSLVAICQAAQNLLSFSCDMALAGGVAITFPQRRGYPYNEGSIGSADGHCRTFDSRASGTVFGNGAAVILLKRLSDAVADGDTVMAVIRGFAMSNDGARRVGYTAPGVDGQAEAIATAQAIAGVKADAISYIEAHGTATPLGDPIEVAALTKAFRETTDAKNFCAIGTAKTNLGHLEHAAGVIGVIKTALSLKHKTLPAMLHFDKPNPKIDFESSPFFVNTKLRRWEGSALPRRAGVSAFGLGGTNAHVILEEAQVNEGSAFRRKAQLLMLSAKSEAALDAATSNLATHLKANPATNLGNAAYTLKVGRRAFEHRRIAVCTDVNDAITVLGTKPTNRVHTRSKPDRNPGIVFIFPGQGVQRLNMGRELYDTEPRFKEEMRRCAELLKPSMGFDLCELMYPKEKVDEAACILNQAIPSQAALFAVEYALAKLWMHWGIQPRAMLGYSIGELVAACLASVISLADALSLLVARGRLLKDVPTGAMLSVRMAESELRKRLKPGVEIASVNSPMLFVISGPAGAIEAMRKEFDAENVLCQTLQSPYAYHSAMMDPLVAPLTQAIAGMRLQEPKVPILSCVTCDWLTAAQAKDPAYWARHAREPVQFSEALKKLQPEQVLLEIGPGSTLSILTRQCLGLDRSVSYSLPDSAELHEQAQMLTALGQMWLAGAQPDWARFYGDEKRVRVPLPTYPFERRRCWIEPPKAQDTREISNTLDAIKQDYSEQNPMVYAGPVTPVIPDRKPRLREQVVTIIEEASGTRLTEKESATHFLELGFDSLLLTQVAQDLKKKFKLAITFRQLQDKESTLDALAAYLDAKLPPEDASKVQAAPVKATAAAMPLLPAMQPMSVQGGEQAAGIANVFKAQLQAMTNMFTQQLDMMQQMVGGAQPAAASGASTSPSTNVVPAVLAEANASSPAKDEQPKSIKPIQKGPAGGTTPQQEAYIKGLVERYTKRTKESKRMIQQHRGVFADPRVAAGFRAQWKEMIYPIVTTRSKGARMWDVDGNEYIDILGGFGPILLGHSPDFVTEAVQKQIKEGIEIGPMTPLAGRVAELIREFTGMERVSFCNSGSEAVAGALRLSRTITGRSKVAIFSGSYHGMFDEVLVKGVKKGGVPTTMPSAPGIPAESVSNMLVLDYGTPEALAAIEQNAQDLAAVLIEPVQSRHPNLQPKEFLQRIREITAKSGTVMIFDEVVTGFRSHPGGAQVIFDIRADIATYGKVLGGGYPIGAIAGKAEFIDALDGGQWQFGDDSYPEKGVTFFAGTFFRHPMMLAAAEAVLLHLKKEGPELQKTLTAKTARLVARLNELFQANHIPTKIETFSSFFYFGFGSDQRFGSLLYYHMREKGVHLQEGFPCFLNIAHTDADLEFVYNAFKESIAEMKAGGVLPATTNQEAARLTNGTKPTSARPAVVHCSEAPLTEEQLEIFLSARLSPEANCAYNESVSLHFDGELNEAALRRAFDEVIARHDALRTVFDNEGERQRFVGDMRIVLPLEDYSNLDVTAREQRLAQEIDKDARQPFDLLNGPMARARLIRLQPKQHVMLYTAHHMVCDGWSTGIVMGELAQLYSTYSQGIECSLPVPMSMGSYALAQRDHLHSAGGAEVEKYWVSQFTPVPPVLDLPADSARPAMRSFAGATCKRSMPPTLYPALKRTSARHRCTLFALLFAGYQILVSRLSGQWDIVTGIPAAGHASLEGASLVGHCVNYLPVRTPIVDNPSIGAFVAQVKQALLQMNENQNYTYGRLVRKLSFQRDPSRLPLTEIQFNLERVLGDDKFAGLDVAIDSNPKASINCDMFFNVVESSATLALECDYNRDLYDKVTIERWLGHYITLLEGIAAADARQHISELAVMTEGERQLLTVDWNQTQSTNAEDKTVVEMFEDQVQRTPDGVAVVFGQTKLTYRELNARSNSVAHYLREKHRIAPDDRVAVLLERSEWMPVALLGVLKAGGAYVPIDPKYPQERIRFMLDDAECKAILTESSITYQPPAGEEPLFLNIRNLKGAETNPGQTATRNSLAYIIYTSGSTGTPKGCQIEHRNLTHYITWARDNYFGKGDHGNFGLYSSLSFDLTVTSIFIPLLRGNLLWVYPNETDVTHILRHSLEPGTPIDSLKITPSHIGLLGQLDVKGSNVRTAIVGGEALTLAQVDVLRQQYPSIAIYNEYGPTETTVGCIVKQIMPDDKRILIGKPIANTQIYIMDASMHPTPPGVAGEICIGGAGVGRGYLKRPELTAEKFVANPFRHGERMYRTGDIGRWLADGNIEFLGRNDDQVKVRGYRIELGEVEKRLSEFPTIKQACVRARETNGTKQMVGYFVSDTELAIAALREHLTARLPEYMVPAYFVRLNMLPLTQNGKIDEKALPAPESATLAKGAEYVAPRDGKEQELAAIWSEVLRLNKVGIYDDIFELGADSLLIYRITTRANKAGYPVTPVQMFQHRTVAALAASLPKMDMRRPLPLPYGRFHGKRICADCVPDAGGR